MFVSISHLNFVAVDDILAENFVSMANDKEDLLLSSNVPSVSSGLHWFSIQ